MKRAFLLVGLLALAGGAVSAQSRPDARGEMISRGRQLFSERGCVRCHTVGKEGTHLALDVTSMARKYSETDLVRWLTDPEAVDPHAHMPKIELSEADRRAIAAFVVDQK